MPHGFAAIFGAAVGFLASMAPQVWAFVIAKWGPHQATDTHEQDSASIAAFAAAGQIDSATIQSQQETIAKQQDTIGKLTNETHHPWVMAILKLLQTSVRPTLTYAIFLVWAVVKLVALYHGLHTEHVPTLTLLPVLWDEDSEALFASIVCFWFGSRQMNSTNFRSAPRVKK